MEIAIYDGEGTSPLFKTHLTAQFPHARFLDASALCSGNWKADVWIIPGGRDRPYHAALKGAGNRALRSFVEEGGTYLGLCAGAYYGCSLVDFDRGRPLEVVEERELGFFPGSAVGPAYGLGTFDYATHKGARAARLSAGEEEFFVYYNGGCTFEGDLQGCSLLATYADLPGSPPAVIERRIGKGRAILSGVHLEAIPSLLDGRDSYLSPLLPSLLASDSKRSEFLRALI